MKEEGTWTGDRRSEIKHLISGSLDHAEGLWEKVGPEFKDINLSEGVECFSTAEASMPTLIPGHESIDPSVPQVSDFAALVLDIRGATNHLLHLERGPSVQQLQRVLYETFGLLPACSRVLEYHKGRTTEYLGDGILGIFHAPEDDRKKLEDSLQGTTLAAWMCMDVRMWVNEELHRRYKLPALDIGIGISWSKAVVTVVGHSKHDLHPKVMGECVYRASKWSHGVNEIQTDERTKKLWPSSKVGILRFRERNKKGVKWYLIDRKSS